MKKINKGMTIIESLIGITLLALITGSILGAFIVVQRYFKESLALAKSQATARIVIEKMVRPIRHGESFTVDGCALTIYGPEDTFTFEDNSIKQNESVIARNIYEVTEGDETIPIFKALKENELVEINFLVRNQGIFNQYQEVRISTEMKLRN